jgi:hypothetical protein
MHICAELVGRFFKEGKALPAIALAGDTAKAETVYQDFFTLWKNADLDIPILQQAKAEYVN